MSERSERPSFLARMSIVTAGARFTLGGPPVQRTTPSPTSGTPASRPATLASEAMRWSYVLRSRERWRDSADISARHQLDATATLNAFGLSDNAIEQIAHAGRVVVTMPFEGETQGWEGRVFPWEYVLSRATRRYRSSAYPSLTVMRQMSPVGAPPLPARTMAARVMVVHSYPGALALNYSGQDEVDRVRRAFGMASTDPRLRVLASPSLDSLAQACAEFRPEIVHLTGFDNHQGLARLAESGGADTRVAVRDEQRPAADWLRDDRGVVDGYLLSGYDGMPTMTSPQALAHALTQGGQLRPLFVGLNLWNSAARIAPQLLPAGVVASMGFQDAFDEALAEYFFETFYSRLAVGRWIVPDAFEQAWAATRLQVDLVPGTGIALWARAPLIDPQATQRGHVQVGQPGPLGGLGGSAATGARVAPPTALIEPKKEINYAELHNQSELFERFELRAVDGAAACRVLVVVELHCGPERARYEAEVELNQQRLSLKGRIKVPLTALLMRSVSEAVVSSLYVQVMAGDTVVHRNTSVFLWGWGVMNSTVLKEAQATGYPRDKMYGVWWSGAEPDVKDIGDGAKGYNALALNPSGQQFKVIQDIMKFVHDKGQGSGPKDEVGSVLYMRGVIIQMLGVEAVKRAQERFGKGKVMTSEQVRWGMENLALDQKKLDALGFAGVIRPISTSCADHMGSTWVRIHTWDGAKWNMSSDWYQADEQIIKPMVKAAAAKYAAEKKIAPRTSADCDA